jgi:hypothetical protein
MATNILLVLVSNKKIDKAKQMSEICFSFFVQIHIPRKKKEKQNTKKTSRKRERDYHCTGA